GEEPELRLPLDGLHHQPEGAGAGRGVLRRGAGEHPGVQPDVGQVVLRHLPRRGRRLRRADPLLDHADRAVPGRSHRREVHRLRRREVGLGRGQGLPLSLIDRRPGLRVGLLLTPPMLWLGVAYLGALGALLITSVWTQNDFTGEIERVWTTENFRTLFTVD